MIRAVLESDLPQIGKLLKLAPEFWRTDWYTEAWRRAVRASNGLTFVWEEAGHIVGFVCAHDIGWLGYLCTLIVAESAYYRDVGPELIRCVESELAARGCGVMSSGSIEIRQVRDYTAPDLILLRCART